MRRALPLFLLLCCRLAGAFTLGNGELSGAKFTTAIPAQWNRCILLHAHGLRNPEGPLLADLAPSGLAYRTLLEEGWIVATTSYRRNGLIIGDALADLDALLAHLTQKYGAPTRVLLEGESMGGLIVTLLAEREPGRYHGALAIGAALDLPDPDAHLGLSLRPKIPLLFLANQTEIEGPRAYVLAPVLRLEAGLRPALFRVSRDGHVNVNQRERLAALRALNAWLDRGRDSLPAPAPGAEFFDAIIPPEPQPSLVTVHADQRGFDCRVTGVSATHGNVSLDAQPADFAAIGLHRLQWLQVTAHARTYRVRFGRDYDSVKRGEWVILADADGFHFLARNHADAASAASLSTGDRVTLRRYDDPAR